MKPSVVAFSGPIASGKTTISLELSKILGWKHASFGNFIRGEAIKRGGDPNSREILQNIGNELIAKGWESFCRSVLISANWANGEGLVIDGIRHLEGLNTIKLIVDPLRVDLVYVSINEDIRTTRLIDRKIDLQKQHLLESNSTETQIREILVSNASVIVSGTETAKSNVDFIRTWLLSK